MEIVTDNWPKLTEDQMYRICSHQKLTSDQIDKFWPKLTEDQMYRICSHQKLTSDQIDKFWPKLTEYQRGMIKTIQRAMPTGKESIERAKAYAKKHNIQIDDKFLYAYRNHDMRGRGVYNKTIFYESGKSYHDFHCDPRSEIENSFGIGIWPKGNTPIKVPLDRFVIEVDREDGKARVLEIGVI